jgi:serine/threonine-protein kinase
VNVAPVQPDIDRLVGVELGGFRVKRLLAAGGMGLVYEAVHEAIGRRAAVKVLRPEVARDAEWTRRFLSEARTLGALKHRNLIEILNFGKTPDGREFLMMEFLDGESLEALIHREAPLPPALALHLVDQVLNGLSEAHKKGVVHRDLKPSNVHVLREHNGERLVKVLDFGLARQDPISLLDGRATPRTVAAGASLVAGTPEYIAPEQALGKAVDASADLYSLGVMLFEMLTGRLPFPNEGNLTALLLRHVNDPPPRPADLIDGLPDELEALVVSLLAKHPAERPPSADEARSTVQRILKRLARDATGVGLRALPLPAEPIVPARSGFEPTVRSIRTAAPRRSRAGVVAALVGVAALGLGVVRWVMAADPTPPTTSAPAPLLEPVVVHAPSPPEAPPAVTPPLVPAEAAPPSVATPSPLPVATPAPNAKPPGAPKPGAVRRPAERSPARAAPSPGATSAPDGPVERCDPEFKEFLTRKLSTLNNDPRVNADEVVAERWERDAAQVLAVIKKAATRAECAAAEDQFRRLRREFGFAP